MSVIGSNIIAGASGTVETGYQISRSLRFNSADSAYLTRTPSVAGNSQKFTISGWVKRSRLSSGEQCIFNARAGAGTPRFRIFFTANDTLQQDSDNFGQLTTTQVFRDSSAWCHILFAADSTQATDTNRKKLYVNGVQVTAFSTSTYPTQNTSSSVNSTIAHDIGVEQVNGIYFNGYLADVRLIDGQALDPTSFGEFDANTGVWVPKAYTGTYGTNGFWLKFDDNSGTTSTTLGKDSSGNGNNWTPNNFSVTAGVGNDSLVDSPTNYGTDTGAGGEVRGNYCTLNPLSKNASATLANGNLQNDSGAAWAGSAGTIAIPNTGKWYFEAVIGTTTSGSVGAQVGLCTASYALTQAGTGGYVVYGTSGLAISNNGTLTNFTGTWSAGDIVQVAADADNGKIWIGRNNSWYDSSGGTTGNPASNANATIAVSPVGLFPTVSTYANSINANFGQRPFQYTAPSGFKALCTQNLPTPAIGASASTLAEKNFNTILYTGTGANQSITGVGFQPDLVWNKARNNIYGHGLQDVLRGVNKQLFSHLTNAEFTTSAGTGLTAFSSNGFSLGADDAGSSAYMNQNGVTYVSWNWKANGAGVSNTAGSITSTVSANTTAGISIVTYSGNSALATIGHGLNAVPKMIIVKARNASILWPVYTATTGKNAYLSLNTTDAVTSTANYFGAANPTSTVFGVDGYGGVNLSGSTYVAYCFAEVAGFSKFGSYTGNGSADGPFVYCGFRPRYIMIKRTDSSTNGDWNIRDTARDPYNVTNKVIFANVADSEYSGITPYDILSNGFKLRDTGANVNGSGATYIFAAFAEAPFNYARAR